MEGQWDDAGQIVHAEWGRRWSGGTNQALLLVRTLKARGVQGVLVCPVGSAMEERAQGQGVPTVSFPLRGEGDLKAWWQFARWLKGMASSGTTLLHAHSRRGALPTLLIARWLRLPTVLHWRVAAPMPRLLARLASFAVAVSEVAAEKARQAGVPKERVAVIRSVVESERFVPPPNARRWARERLELPADAFVVAGVGRMVAGKGYEQLVEAVALMVPTERPHLLLTGDGPMRAELERTAAKRRVGNWVRFLGFQTDVRPVLWAADVLAHVPTHFPEGTPNTILEGMAAGLPVIATPIGGIAEIVRHGETGWLVPPNDASALAEALRHLRANPSLRRRLGEAAQTFVREHHSVSALIERILRVYAVVMSERLSATLR
jgi:glycosyltransferase involved in cell wall biosynthesis